jgi:hypothetical protein
MNMAYFKKEILSPEQANMRLVQLGAVHQSKYDKGKVLLYWSDGNNLWLRAVPNGNTWILEYHRGCPC